MWSYSICVASFWDCVVVPAVYCNTARNDRPTPAASSTFRFRINSWLGGIKIYISSVTWKLHEPIVLPMHSSVAGLWGWLYSVLQYFWKRSIYVTLWNGHHRLHCRNVVKSRSSLSVFAYSTIQAKHRLTCFQLTHVQTILACLFFPSGIPRVYTFDNGRVNETINYNERFHWDDEGFVQGRAGFGKYGRL